MNAFLQYRPLFFVQILNDYYLSEEAALFSGSTEEETNEILQKQRINYRLDRDLEIQPTGDTEKRLADRRLIFKKNQQGFLVGAQVSPDGSAFVPFIPLNEPFALRFAVYLQNPHFFNFTNLRLERDPAQKDQYLYYFSNRANNVDSAATRYLSRAIPDFDATYAYEAGELFINGTPTMREAIEDNGPAVFDGTQWRQLFSGVDPLPQFVTARDRIVLRPSIFKVNVQAVSEEVLIFRIKDRNGVEVKNITHRSSEIGTPITECELDLTDLQPAVYEIEAEDTGGNVVSELGLTFFKDDMLAQKRPFALIEVFHEPDNSLGEYRWLDETDGNKLLSPQYTIRWKNRATWWRYYHEESPTFTSTAVENLNPVVNSPNHRILISSDPLALTQVGRAVPMDVDGEIQLLPNPGVELIYPEDGRIYSELDMGGGLGPPS